MLSELRRARGQHVKHETHALQGPVSVNNRDAKDQQKSCLAPEREKRYQQRRMMFQIPNTRTALPWRRGDLRSARTVVQKRSS